MTRRLCGLRFEGTGSCEPEEPEQGAMAYPDFQVVVEAAEGGTRIELVGELDVATAPELRRHVDEIGGAGGDVWIDCTELSFADSSGLEVLTLLAKALRAQHRRLVLTNLRPMVRRAMDVLQITDLFELEEAP
jgi:anti-sigma B factor antagonist